MFTNIISGRNRGPKQRSFWNAGMAIATVTKCSLLKGFK
jgi:hypothetical protein